MTGVIIERAGYAKEHLFGSVEEAKDSVRELAEAQGISEQAYDEPLDDAGAQASFPYEFRAMIGHVVVDGARLSGPNRVS